MPNPIKPTIKTELIPIIILLALVISSFYFYNLFPEQVAIHWNIAGEADSWGSRLGAAFGFPLVIIGMYFLLILLPYLDPKKDRYDQFRKVYHFFKTILIFFMVLIYFISSLKNIGYNIQLEIWIPFIVGILFMTMGNYMGKIKSNWFLGIRTPWTLSNEEAWNKTHRVAGRMFIIAGFLMAVIGFAPVSLRSTLFVASIGTVLVGTIGYSYFAYKKEIRNNKK